MPPATIKTGYLFAKCTKCTTNPWNVTNRYASSKIDEESSRQSRDCAKNNEAEPRPRHLVRYRAHTEAEGCQGRAETKTDKKMLRGCLKARQLPRGLHHCLLKSLNPHEAAPESKLWKNLAVVTQEPNIAILAFITDRKVDHVVHDKWQEKGQKIKG